MQRAKTNVMIPNEEIGFVSPKSPLAYRSRDDTPPSYPAIELDHRSARSCCKSAKISCSFITGFRAGNSLPADNGGLIQPWRSASRRSRSETSGLRPGAGGPSSATTRSRSMTSTVSPPAAELRVAVLSIVAMRQVALPTYREQRNDHRGERLIYIDFLTQNWVRSADFGACPLI
jgi:hypothetical protein